MTARHTQKTIDRACELFKKGIPLREIVKRTPIKSTSTILFRCDPGYAKAHNDRGEEWRKKHPKRWKEINAKAVRKYQKKIKK